MRDERRDETDKKRHVARDEIDQKEYKDKLQCSQKRAKDCYIQTLRHTYKNKKNYLFFRNKGSLLKRKKI